MFASLASFGGLVWKRRFTLTQSQKYRHRLRLRAVDNIVDTVIKSGVSLKALDFADSMMREPEMTPEQKYWVHSKRFRNGIKPAHWVPHWTKTRFERSWAPSIIHEPIKKSS
ncbi:hypothetical protein HDU81_008502 [Chytriomyces hyalinus]|nr:hypothetical protein HDU81_008502 [Chytriomyces hyalinus]